MTRAAGVLLGVIGLAVVLGAVVFVVRYQPFGPPAAAGIPLPSGARAAEGWVGVPDAPFERLEMATAVLDGRVWLAGGLAPDGSVIGELWSFDPADGSWAEEPALPEPVHHAALATDGERLFLVGGFTGDSGQPTDAVRMLDLATGQWTDGPALPEPRAAGALAHDGERFVYGGGVGPGGVRAEIFVLADDAWSEAGALERAREHLAATTDGNGRVWLMGGRQGGLDRNIGDVELVEVDTVELVASITARGGVAAFFVPGIGACLTGGEAPSFAFATVECVDDRGRVTALPDMTQRRHGHGAGVVDGAAYALLGGDTPGLDASSTVERLALDD